MENCDMVLKKKTRNKFLGCQRCKCDVVSVSFSCSINDFVCLPQHKASNIYDAARRKSCKVSVEWGAADGALCSSTKHDARETFEEVQTSYSKKSQSFKGIVHPK